MSKRVPWLSFDGNVADCLERCLEKDSHRIWGFIIFRCTYGDDAAWARHIETLREEARCSLDYYNAPDIFTRLEITVVEDREALEGASTAVVRVYFSEWVKGGVVEWEQGMPDAGMSPRYRFCIRVRDVGDAASADGQGQEDDEEDNDDNGDEDIEEDKDEEDEEDEENEEGSVDLIWKDWEPSVPDPRQRPEPPVEGSTRPGVGWMRVSDSTVMVTMYELLYHDPDMWYIAYRRPPEVVVC
ncbi:uncharacterized protein DNG_09660 [Cephalotrichum gorgonifer]|uniref:Uncharacterized protein n=1 Tax=Cephalotrichum gorgonifer TaxID=2041049 RepID=A0AAE8N644_9PEZI|nr:uncharacterized protein DNG_09660 [Cephalotrichum gorgonifer]